MHGSHDQLNLNQQTIAYCLIWELEIDIEAIIFSDLVNKLQNGKKNMEANICYTRFLSLMFTKLLGENYINGSLTFVKPHTILAASFQKPLAFDVRLTSYMLKVAKLSQDPDPSLILSSEKVNADDTADKSSSKTSVQPVSQPKAPTDLKPKKKKVPPSSQPKSSYKEEVKEFGLESMEDVTFNQIMDEIDKENKAVEKLKSPFDTESEIKIIKRFQPSQSDDDAQITFLGAEPYNQTKSTNGDFDSDLRSMLDDELVSLTGFKTLDSADDKSKEGTGETFYASADMPAQSDPLGHLHEELRILNNKIDQLESSITKKVTDDIQSSVPSIDSIKQSVLKYIEEKLPVCTAQVQQSLQDQLPKILLRLINREFNAFNTLESRRYRIYYVLNNLAMFPPDHKKFHWGIAHATGRKGFTDPKTGILLKRINHKIQIPIDLNPCRVEEKLTMKEVDGETIMKLKTKMIAKDGTVSKFPRYTPLKEEEEEPEKKG
ncbi:hypothetical protein Tco_0431008 [Tanacetum coccineum]